MPVGQENGPDTAAEVFRDLAAVQDRDAAAAVCTALRTTLHSPSSFPEKFEDWLLAGVAAAVALFINDVDKLSTLVAPGAFVWSIDLLTISLICGGLGKIVGLIAAAQFNAYENAKPELERAFEAEAAERAAVFQRAAQLKLDLDASVKFTEIFRKKYLATFIPITSWWIGWRMTLALKKPHVELAVYTSVVRKFQVRAIGIVFSIIFAVAGAAVAAISINETSFQGHASTAPALPVPAHPGTVGPTILTPVSKPTDLQTHPIQSVHSATGR